MKIHARENFRIVVIPDEPWLLSKENLGMTQENFGKWSRACKEIVEQIKRHVDGFDDVCQDFDSRDICSFCGNTWEEEDSGCPVCCQRAIDEWEETHPPEEASKEGEDEKK